MGSLKNIMDLDEDHPKDLPQDIRSRRRSISTPSPRASTAMPRYAVHMDYAASQYTPRRHSPQYSLPSSSSLSFATSGQTGTRRRSNTSVDSMDSNFGQSLGHANAYSMTSIRPLTSGAIAGEHPVKLTPITGRVSRAKKGVPVHTCEICRPAKTFTRAEHLRRHQLSHQPPDLACTVPGCDKVFHRKDLLERHQQRHEQDESMGKEASQSSRRSISTTSPNQGYPTSPPLHPLQMQTPFGSLSSTEVPSSSIPELSMPSNHWSSPVGRLRRDHPQDAHDAYNLDMKSEYVIDSVSGIASSNTRMIPGFDEPRTAMAMRGLLSSVVDLSMSDSGMAWPEGLPSSASESAYSTPPSEQHMPSRTPSMEWTGQMPAFPLSSSPMMASGAFPLSFGYDTTPPQSFAPLYGGGMGFALPGYEDRNPMYASHVLDPAVRGQLLTGQPSEPLVTVADRSMCSRSLSRDSVDALGLFMAQDVMSVSLKGEVRGAIPAYLEVYWDKAHQMHPIIHRATYDDASQVAPGHLEILQCAMAAVATQFLEHKEHRNHGHQLHAYAWEKSKMLTTSQDWPLPIMQAILLCEYYARFRGRCKKAYRPSLRFETLYQMVINVLQVSDFPLHLSASGSSQRWRYWVDLESRRRILSACFLLDVHTMNYFEQSRVAVVGLNYDTPETLPIPLSVSTSRLWDAQSSLEWSSMDHTNIIHTTVSSALLSEISAADIAAIPIFDAALLQAAHALRLPTRRSPTEVDLVADISSINVSDFALANLFPCSPSAMTYLALYHTPLHALLAVSGDSWLFNKKLPHAQAFAAHKAQLRAWRDSGSAALAATFAARALAALLSVRTYTPRGAPKRKEISDFWAVYACALVCWAFGHSAARGGGRPAALRWIAEVADMAPCAVRGMSDRERAEGSGVVGLARRYVERECLGGKNMLLGDALGVLKKLEDGDGYAYF